MPSLALLFHLIDGVDTGRRGPVSGAAAAQAAAWCEYLAAHARRLYAAVTDAARVAAALLATRLAHGRLASPFTAREVYRQEWTGLTEPRVVQGALECLEELGWIRPEALRAPDGGRPTSFSGVSSWSRCRGSDHGRVSLSSRGSRSWPSVNCASGVGRIEAAVWAYHRSRRRGDDDLPSMPARQ